MTIAAGTKLRPYEIVPAIGAGGMGEVYGARDSKLGRDVAVKVLHEADIPSDIVRCEVGKIGAIENEVNAA